jgi:hypothetical protein
VSSKDVFYLHERYEYADQERKESIINTSYPLSMDSVLIIQKGYDALVAKYFANKLNISSDKHILPKVGKCLDDYGNNIGCKAPNVCFHAVKNLTEWIFATENSFIVL